MKLILKTLIDEFPFSYFSTLKTKKFEKLYNFIIENTKFIDYKTPISTSCWYILNNKSQLITCHHCGKVIRKTLKPTLKQQYFWCDGKCSDNDPIIKKLIGQKNKQNKIGKPISYYDNELPSECCIKMKKQKIVYDTKLTNQLHKLFNEHKKNFKYWIIKNKTLYKYLLDKSYPLNYTKLNLETRLFWIINKLQEIPKCKTCGRQLDFKNVKLSNVWPKYCSLKCQHKSQEIKNETCLRNAKRFFNKYFKNSKLIKPKFTIKEFAENRHNKQHLYKCKCKKCGSIFKSQFNKNFFIRCGQKQSAFRCKKCFPELYHRQSHDEIELDEYIESIVGKENVLRGSRKIIYPYELDCYVPSLKIAFEFNGIYWHSHNKIQDKNVHLNKTKLCEKLGIKLIYIWEDNWKNENEKTKQFIKNILTDPDYILTFYKITDKTKQVIIDRELFNECFSLKNFTLVKTTRPKLILRKHIHNKITVQTYNCGQLIYKRIT